MNIAFFLTPKKEIVTLNNKMTIRQAMEVMEYHRYSAVPVIDKLGKYVYTLSEGDILWHLKHKEGLMFRDTEKEGIDNIQRNREIKAVDINADIESLIDLSITQGFVPVKDDQDVFIGIIKRSDILNYGLKSLSREKISSISIIIPEQINETKYLLS